MLFKKNFLIFLGLVFVSFTADSAPPEKPPKNGRVIKSTTLSLI